MQRIILSPAKVGDWAVIGTRIPLTRISEGRQDSVVLYGAEGEVVSVQDGKVKLALNGNHGIGGAGMPAGAAMGGTWVEAPCEMVFPMILPVLRAGDPVTILRGAGEGLIGEIAEIHHGNVVVSVPGRAEPVQTVIERVEKIVPHSTYLDTLSEETSRG